MTATSTEFIDALRAYVDGTVTYKKVTIENLASDYQVNKFPEPDTLTPEELALLAELSAKLWESVKANTLNMHDPVLIGMVHLCEMALYVRIKAKYDIK